MIQKNVMQILNSTQNKVSEISSAMKGYLASKKKVGYRIIEKNLQNGKEIAKEKLKWWLLLLENGNIFSGW